MSIITIIAALGCIVFFHRVGEAEYDGNILPACVSVILWVLGLFVLHHGLFVNLVLQAALFLSLTLYNIYRDGRG